VGAVAEGLGLIDLPTAARRLGINRITANLLVLEGRLPAQKLGQRWVIDEEEFARFAASYQPDKNRGREPLRPEAARPVLEALHDHQGATVGELAQLVGRPRRTVLGWVQMLDEEGLVERRRGRGSRDPDRCFLTEDGRTFCKGGEGAVVGDGMKP
jgi:DNA-binding MarR family transcriptional regulator